jgi:hypothetical protein
VSQPLLVDNSKASTVLLASMAGKQRHPRPPTLDSRAVMLRVGDGSPSYPSWSVTLHRAFFLRADSPVSLKMNINLDESTSTWTACMISSNIDMTSTACCDFDPSVCSIVWKFNAIAGE